MADAYLIQSDTLTEIADAIRTKKGESSSVKYTPASMANAILSLGELTIGAEIDLEVTSGMIMISPDYVGGDVRNFVGFFGTEDCFGEDVACIVTQSQVAIDNDNDAYYTIMGSSSASSLIHSDIWIDESVIEIFIDPYEMYDSTLFSVRCIYKNIY